MQKGGDSRRVAGANPQRATFPKTPNRDQPFWLKDAHHLAQMTVTGGEYFRLLQSRQFVAGTVRSARFHKSQGPIIDYKVPGEKIHRQRKPSSEQTPQAPAADL